VANRSGAATRDFVKSDASNMDFKIVNIALDKRKNNLQDGHFLQVINDTIKKRRL